MRVVDIPVGAYFFGPLCTAESESE